jgi:large subunit ribosomal protein L9
MSIEVILKEHVEHLGRRGEIVKVADGYARNYLFPRKLALVVTSENRKQIERERVKAEAREAEETAAARVLAATIDAMDIAVARRVGENDTLYGSVTASDVADALAARDVVVDRRKVHLVEPLKTLGTHEVPIKLHRDVTATLKVTIIPAT